MKKSFTFQIMIFIAWIAIVPLSIYAIYLKYPPTGDIDWGLLLGLTCLSLVTAYWPANINGVPYFLIQWVSLAVFLRFGLFIEIIVFQISMIPFIYRLQLPRQQLYRMPWNSIMFLLVSFLSGFAFLEFGGEIHTDGIKEIVGYGLLYILVNITANHILLKLSGLLLGNRSPFFTMEDAWDYLTCCFVLPMGISLYILGEHVGVIAIILLGIPFFIAIKLLELYGTSSKLNKELSNAAHFGHQLADRLSSEETLDLFMDRVPKMVSVDGLYMIDRRKQTGTLSVLRAYENGKMILKNVTHKELSTGLLTEILTTETKFEVNKRSELDLCSNDYLPSDTQSVLALPLLREKSMEGILLLTSKKKNFFKDYQIKILELICSYFIVSLEKARYVENAKHSSERCGLTGLFNYRYFDQHLTDMMGDLNNRNISNLSLIMLDIDYFKRINDNYGHQSGNDILCGIADLLRREVASRGTIARYGGEEFVVLLPNYSKKAALKIAEHLRKTIEQQPFEISPDLIEDVSHLVVHVTASIGVSSAYEDTDDGPSLLRNADQAMYIGAKQKGRNRVAGF
ncbi:sensor domain-containing diguanylate cyclase [Rummeliibacillus sp. POC4]|uniref:sensor domain-containing diguanylate cyclase n=1 Tax=Rummeliibacillus sp. POC4 TaxID=2305899 RepID=UPI000E673DBF|nr:sensor domain-containing diguanylate cyclase [Rummeliibacillus sp. POC4]RIJ64715.1 GGDEF domain-containing protein [Rummeliibacillus sp. POC4]